MTLEELTKQAEKRIVELSSVSIPKNELALVRELEHLDAELGAVSGQISMSGTSEGAADRYKTSYDRLIAARNTLLAAQCAPNLDAYLDARAKYITAEQTLRDQLQYLPIDMPVMRLMRTRTTGLVDEGACSLEKQDLASRASEAALKTFNADATSMIANVATENKKYRDVLERWKGALEQARAKLQDALNNISPQQRITANLPLILLILGGACVLAIIGIKLFDEQIQMEWVASGQVIQFVTVMVLLSVIVALGLSDILKETTLGTLLGGIAGYVLAQGVGRAAARDATRAPGRFRSSTDVNQG